MISEKNHPTTPPNWNRDTPKTIPQRFDKAAGRVKGWIGLFEAVAKDFDQSLPYRAGVFLAVCSLSVVSEQS